MRAGARLYAPCRPRARRADERGAVSLSKQAGQHVPHCLPDRLHTLRCAMLCCARTVLCYAVHAGCGGSGALASHNAARLGPQYAAGVAVAGVGQGAAGRRHAGQARGRRPLCTAAIHSGCSSCVLGGGGVEVVPGGGGPYRRRTRHAALTTMRVLYYVPHSFFHMEALIAKCWSSMKGGGGRAPFSLWRLDCSDCHNTRLSTFS